MVRSVDEFLEGLPPLDTTIGDFLDGLAINSLNEALSLSLEHLKEYSKLKSVTKSQLADISDNYRIAEAACTMIEYFSGEDCYELKVLARKYHDIHAMPF
jgi:hypothetical protein